MKNSRKKKTWTQRISNKIKGYKSQLKGLDLERKIANLWANKGYKVKQRVKTTTQEIDLICEKSGLLRSEIVFIECKNKEKVSVKDFIKFCQKFRKFVKKREENYSKIEGWLYYTGSLDRDIKWILEILPKNERKMIKIKKIIA